MIDYLMLAGTGEMTRGAMKMASYDPNGWTLSVVAVSVVFIGLIVLFFVYSLSGRIFMGKGIPKLKVRKRKSGGEMNDEVAAAIAVALDMECGNKDIVAAIATALHLHLNECPHDKESGKITIIPRSSNWRSLTPTLPGTFVAGQNVEGRTNHLRMRDK